MFCTKCQKFQPLFDVKHYCQLSSCLILAGRLIAFCNYVNQSYGRVDLYVRRYPASRVASIFPSKIEDRLAYAAVPPYPASSGFSRPDATGEKPWFLSRSVRPGETTARRVVPPGLSKVHASV